MTTDTAPLGVRGYRRRDADMLAGVWRGDDLITSQSTPGWPMDLPEPGRANIVLVAPMVGVAHLADVEFVHRRARLTIATVTEDQRSPLLKAVIDIATCRINLRRLYGYLPVHDLIAEEIVQAQGFRPELVIPEHGISGGLPTARTVWGWVA
jgi:hypothetical protein